MQGDDSLTALYRAYGSAIFARCRALLGDEAEAEDATQETFLRVYRHLARVPDRNEALYWIYRVATNYCLNEIRNRKRRPEPHGALPEVPVRLDAEERLTDRASAILLILRSRPKLQPIAWLYHIDGFDQEQVASILGLSRRTVASRLADFARSVVRRQPKGASDVRDWDNSRGAANARSRQ